MQQHQIVVRGLPITCRPQSVYNALSRFGEVVHFNQDSKARLNLYSANYFVGYSNPVDAIRVLEKSPIVVDNNLGVVVPDRNLLLPNDSIVIDSPNAGFQVARIAQSPIAQMSRFGQTLPNTSSPLRGRRRSRGRKSKWHSPRNAPDKPSTDRQGVIEKVTMHSVKLSTKTWTSSVNSF